MRGDNETGRVLRAVGVMQGQLKQRAVDELTSRERERAIASENLRIKVGLDNVSGNVIGALLGNAFRFWAFRRFVFNTLRTPAHAFWHPLDSGFAGRQPI